jgi:hypothetical protein
MTFAGDFFPYGFRKKFFEEFPARAVAFDFRE